MSLVDPFPATIATIVILVAILLLPLIVYFRIILRFACNKSLQSQLATNETKSSLRSNSNASSPSPPPPMLLSFSNVTYTVKKSEHQIVKGISGWFSPNTLTAILGTSGCGKTTLLSVLAGQMDATGSSTGEVCVNSRPTRQANFRQLCAYVLQSDNLLESLTVKEFLWFASELRLDAARTQDEKLTIVNGILHDLDLGLVGNREICLLSGGQKRRVTVACELVSQPSLIFLDEPTSGLDASGSLKLVKVLRKLADQGRTVVATIHQPRIDAFNLFHMMLLMNQGRALYFGPIANVIKFMRPTPAREQLAEEEMEENPADFVLDLTHGSPEQVLELTSRYASSALCQSVQETVDKLCNGNTLLQPGEFFGFTQDAEWFPHLQRIPPHCDLFDDLDANKTTGESATNRAACPAPPPCDCFGWRYVFSYTSTLLKQHFTLIRRAMLNEWRNTSYKMTWVLGIIMMLFMGMLYCYVSPPQIDSRLLPALEENLQQWGACTQNFTELDLILNLTSTGSSSKETLEQCGYDLNRSNQLELARSSLLYQLLASMFFSEMPLINMMFQDRQLFHREHASRSYSTLAWVLSWVSKFTFTGFVKGLLFPPFVYFSAQLTLSAEAYFLFSIFMGIMSIAGATFALLAVICFNSPESATVAFVCVNVVAQNLSGYFIAQAYIPWWFRFVTYFNFFTYCYEGMLFSQKLSPQALSRAIIAGSQDEYNETELTAWVAALVAILICVAFQILAFVILAALGENQFRKIPNPVPCCGDGGCAAEKKEE